MDRRKWAAYFAELCKKSVAELKATVAREKGITHEEAEAEAGRFHNGEGSPTADAYARCLAAKHA